MLTINAAPAPLITSAELVLKGHLRLDDTESDDVLDAYIATATAWMDGPTGVLGRCLGPQTWDLKIASFLADPPDYSSPVSPWVYPSDVVRLPLFPVTAVAYVKYLDDAGIEQTFDPANYYLFGDARGNYLKLVPTSFWPTVYARDDAVRIRFTAGYADAASVPAPIKQAIRVLTAHQYAFREIQVDERTFPSGFDIWDLITPYRRVF